MSRCGVIIPDTRNRGEINLYCKYWDFHGWTAVHRNRRSFSRSHSCAMGHSTLKQIPSLVYFSKCGDPEGTDIASFLGWWMFWGVSGLLGGDWSHLGCPCTMEILNANGQHYNTLLCTEHYYWLSRKRKEKKDDDLAGCLAGRSETLETFFNAVVGFWKKLFSAGEWRLPVGAPETFPYSSFSQGDQNTSVLPAIFSWGYPYAIHFI